MAAMSSRGQSEAPLPNEAFYPGARAGPAPELCGTLRIAPALVHGPLSRCEDAGDGPEPASVSVGAGNGRAVPRSGFLVALDRFLKSARGPQADLWDMLESEVLEPIGIVHFTLYVGATSRRRHYLPTMWGAGESEVILYPNSLVSIRIANATHLPPGETAASDAGPETIRAVDRLLPF